MGDTITTADHRQIRVIFQKTKRAMAALLDRRERELGGFPHGQTRNVMIAQNTLRTCMEVVLNECLPYDDILCAELAIRLAAYAISAIPIERQPLALKVVIEGLPGGLAQKIREGAIIKTTWVTDGVSHPNVPEKSDVN